MARGSPRSLPVVLLITQCWQGALIRPCHCERKGRAPAPVCDTGALAQCFSVTQVPALGALKVNSSNYFEANDCVLFLVTGDDDSILLPPSPLSTSTTT